jgi:uncharacterized membrane protein YphA (DoxX/SURF4 family)
VVFLYYGLTCLFANGMAKDFERFGLAHLRILTGTLEVLGAVGLVVGHWIPLLRLLSAAGLALLMLLGLLTRLRQRDALREMLPAWVLMVVNVSIALLSERVR